MKIRPFVELDVAEVDNLEVLVNLRIKTTTRLQAESLTHLSSSNSPNFIANSHVSGNNVGVHHLDLDFLVSWHMPTRKQMLTYLIF